MANGYPVRNVEGGESSCRIESVACQTYSRRQYKVSVTYRLLTVPYLKKTPSKTVQFYSAGHDAILARNVRH